MPPATHQATWNCHGLQDVPCGFRLGVGWATLERNMHPKYPRISDGIGYDVDRRYLPWTNRKTNCGQKDGHLEHTGGLQVCSGSVGLLDHLLSSLRTSESLLGLEHCLTRTFDLFGCSFWSMVHASLSQGRTAFAVKWPLQSSKPVAAIHDQSNPEQVLSRDLAPIRGYFVPYLSSKSESRQSCFCSEVALAELQTSSSHPRPK